MKKIFINAVWVLFLALTSCIETVDIASIGDTTPKIAVEGMITNEAKPHIVRLRFSRLAVSGASANSVTGARVSISDGENTFLLQEIADGVYATEPTVKGEVGKTYTLTIEYNGSTFTASDVMPAPVEFDEGDNVFVFDKYFFGSPSRGFTISYPLVTYGAEKPVKTELTVLPVSPNANGGRSSYYYFPGIDSEGLIPTTATPLEFAFGDTIQQKKIAISDDHYRFVRAVLLETKYYGGVLSSVPANVQTNVSNGAVGFFAASSAVTRKSVLK